MDERTALVCLNNCGPRSSTDAKCARRITCRALSRIEPIHGSFVELFEQRYDAILTPAAHGAAPNGLASTGDPSFCTLWTLCGMPALSLPLLQSSAGMPLGVQLVGPRYSDARLLRTARWLAAKVATS